ncbi:MAG: rhomboid family intramembrane serine protease [Verrucomicrobia bacterium]|nr:rhomboid family intramembrane serine protease [Verrucomicrobiota bacterium]
MRQLYELPNLFRQGNRYPVSTALAFTIVCGYALQWICSFWGPGQIEPWLGLSRSGLLGGCLWQFLTYPFLGELDNPLGSMCLVIGLMSVGRELENIIGRKQFSLLIGSATVLPGLAAVLHSPAAQLLGAWPGVFAIAVALAEALPECQLSVPYFRIGVRYRFLGVGLLAVLFASWLLAWFPFGHTSPYANLLGAGIGWLYIRLLGFGKQLPGEAIFRNWLIRRKQIARMPARQYVTEFVDPILDKIHTVGMDRLSRSERRILRKARQKARRKRFDNGPA